MSFLEKYLAGWTFRTSTPSLTVGSEVNVFVHRYDEHAGDGDGSTADTATATGAENDTETPTESTGMGVADIGDTRLYVEGVGPEHVDVQIRVRITEFDESTATGRGEFVQVVGESSYAG
ncbi:hypothetical protein Halru_0535 [Halovivax ruber XH-70]|uniref:DUF7513 domain-containing protein n=1 Tax=Halovivax ruber (strain DSM 18193 / JCM 13892 / XH-70) TaxID=797302 RepID=L0I8N1_HALRX|nr:hypothetical protein [Halovivax ruber]AGB15168.1 hypothetical protein Halru_0535 [Halovivax ruber XH-70]